MANDPSASELSISLQGQLLLASPGLRDGTFDRSVIILAEHSALKGAFGMIINHRTDATVGDLLPDNELASLHKLPVHHGGPVATDELTFSSFTWNDTTGLGYIPRISAKVAATLVKKPDHIVQAIIGHSAWTAGQLENELLGNTWITAKPTKAILTHPNDISLWNELLKNISPYHHLLSQAPPNPFLN